MERDRFFSRRWERRSKRAHRQLIQLRDDLDRLAERIDQYLDETESE